MFLPNGWTGETAQSGGMVQNEIDHFDEHWRIWGQPRPAAQHAEMCNVFADDLPEQLGGAAAVHAELLHLVQYSKRMDCGAD